MAPIVAEAKPLKGLKMGRCKRILIDGGERAVDVDVQRVGQDLLLVICDPSTGANLFCAGITSHCVPKRLFSPSVRLNAQGLS